MYFYDTAYALIAQGIAWMLGLGVCFALLSRLFPCNPGSHWWKNRREALNDALYWLVIPIPLVFLRQAALIGCASLLFAARGEAWMDMFFMHGYGLAARLPLWAQCLLIVVIQDIYMYWTHRLFHTRGFWRTHAIHHSPRVLDWTSTRRFHPLNSFVSFYMADVIVLLLGFPPAAIVALVPFNVAYSALVHANLNWTFGPFRYVLVSPVYHRWHHTGPNEGGNRNFAPTFPLLDMLFGTLYLPQGRLPERYGVSDKAFPQGLWAQMAYPFKKQRI